VLISFMLLYQNRLYALLNVFALQAVVLPFGCMASLCARRATSLYHRRDRALFQGDHHSVSLHRIIARLGIHASHTVRRIGPTMLAGIALVALSMVVMLRVTSEADSLAREDLAFALSVVLLGLLMMVTRGNAVSQVIGFMSLENGLILAATGAKACRSWSRSASPFRPYRFYRDRDFPVPNP